VGDALPDPISWWARLAACRGEKEGGGSWRLHEDSAEGKERRIAKFKSLLKILPVVRTLETRCCSRNSRIREKREGGENTSKGKEIFSQKALSTPMRVLTMFASRKLNKGTFAGEKALRGRQGPKREGQGTSPRDNLEIVLPFRKEVARRMPRAGELCKEEYHEGGGGMSEPGAPDVLHSRKRGGPDS